MSKFIKTLRQFVDYEYDNSKLYKNYPSMSNVNSTYEMECLLVKADNKSNQMAKFHKLLESGGDLCYPFAGTIHRYLKKYDSQWYTNEYTGSDS